MTKEASDMAAITSFENLPLVLHVKELAEVLSISQNTAYALVRSEQIRSIRTGRIYRIPKDALIEYLSKG
jgi:excisionase family DNA binding protein